MKKKTKTQEEHRTILHGTALPYDNNHIRSHSIDIPRPHAVLPWYPDRIASSRHAQRICRTRWLATHSPDARRPRAGRRARPRPHALPAQAPERATAQAIGFGEAPAFHCSSVNNLDMFKETGVQ